MDVYFILFIVSSNYAALSAFQLNVTLPKKLLVKALSSAEAPARHPNKNSNNRQIESARGTMGRGKRRELLLFPLPTVPRALSFSLSPVLPTIQRGLCRGESCKGQFNHSLLSNKYVSTASYQTLKTTKMKFEKLFV